MNKIVYRIIKEYPLFIVTGGSVASSQVRIFDNLTSAEKYAKSLPCYNDGLPFNITIESRQ